MVIATPNISELQKQLKEFLDKHDFILRDFTKGEYLDKVFCNKCKFGLLRLTQNEWVCWIDDVKLNRGIKKKWCNIGFDTIVGCIKCRVNKK